MSELALIFSIMLSNADMLRFSLSCWNVYNITNPAKEEKFMNAVLEERPSEILADEEKRYVKLSYEDIKKISDELIEQNMEAYIALANN